MDHNRKEGLCHHKCPVASLETLWQNNVHHEPRIQHVAAQDKTDVSKCTYRVRNLKFATSKTLVNFMKKIMF